jgi:succinate-semialdehyde dehydrogenase/glutarate-semialdehyde dehydrogenase
MEFISINPTNGKLLESHPTHSNIEVNQLVLQSKIAYRAWSNNTLDQRIESLKQIPKTLRSHIDQYANQITIEMGKPLKESEAEIEKCAILCDYYIENSSSFLADEIIITDAQKSYVKYCPSGTILGIMPWNFPFWQVFRFAIPNLIIGNVVLLKHAPNTQACAKLIENIFKKIEVEHVYQNVIVEHEQIENIIANDIVKGVSLTGSEKAGSAVAQIAGKYIKKSVLELGGSNAFIVCEDANLSPAVKTAITARMLNAGQSCIAAKRIILVESIYEEFLTQFINKIEQLKMGDPLDEDTDIGPLARKDLSDTLNSQIKQSVYLGAKILYGGNKNACFHEPTVLTNITTEMPVFNEETFGPLAIMIKAKDLNEAFEIASKSKYGLGLSVFSSDINSILPYIAQVEDGAIFINEMVKSDPRLPFGGTKKSGYGRELAKEGLLEFANIKTVYIK